MANKLRVAVIGTAHSHIGTLAQSFYERKDDVEMVAIADVAPLVKPLSKEPGTRVPCLEDIVEKCGVPSVYDCYKELLSKERPDLVIMCAENAFHGRVGADILSSGAHLVMEKPFASSMQDALRMVRAARAADKRIIVNWPSTWNPAIRTAQRLASEGVIGKLFKLTYRNGDSQGPLSYGQVITDTEKGAEWWHQSAPGGGALLDYCCYGACLSRWILGEKPKAAYGVKANFDSPYGDAEDYAAITVNFPHAVAILEGSWTTVNSGVPAGPVIFGTQGTLVADWGEVRVYTTRHQREPDDIVKADPLPVGRATLGEEVIHHLRTGEPLHPTLDLDINLDAMGILDAGIRSAVSGKREDVTDAVWTIG